MTIADETARHGGTETGCRASNENCRTHKTLFLRQPGARFEYLGPENF
jgi:hypothetical protein